MYYYTQYSSAYRRSFFESTFNAIARSIAFDPTWTNGTGYFNGVFEGKNPILVNPTNEKYVSLPGQVVVTVDNGEAVKFIDPANRKAIFIGTALGGVLVFERYSPDDGDDKVYRCQSANAFRSLDLLTRSSPLMTEDLINIFGDLSTLDISERVNLFTARIKGEA